MRHAIPLLCLLATVSFSYAQDSTITLSAFEQFTSRPGSIVKTEIKTAGNFGWNALSLFTATDRTTGEKMNALRIGNYTNSGFAALVDPYAIYIDMDEADTLLQVLRSFLNETQIAKPANYQQLTYITSKDIAFTVFFDTSTDSWRFVIGKLYKQERSYVPNTLSSFNKKRFSELVELISSIRQNAM